jgi:NADH-quinone oxidoreductase subunit L
MHHEQDLRKMGGLWRHLPITWATAVIGSLALAGIPPFAGFFSKDAIIEATHASTIPGHGFAYFAVMAGVFITAFYSFRMLFLAFHGSPRWTAAEPHPVPSTASPGAHDASHEAGAEPDPHAGHGSDADHPPRETPWVVTGPLVLLAIPSIYAGWAYIEPMLFGGYFGNAIVVAPAHDVLAPVKSQWHGAAAFIQHALATPPLWLALAGIAAAWICYIARPAWPERLRRLAGPLYTLLDNKYYFDRINDVVFAAGSRKLGALLSNVGDRSVIDGFFVNGTARVVNVASTWMRRIQSGYVYHYAFTMIVGVFALLFWFNR